MNFYRATHCAHCGKELNSGVVPARMGVCPPCELFDVMWGALIREHNAKLDALDAQRPKSSQALRTITTVALLLVMTLLALPIVLTGFLFQIAKEALL